jgi:hypothetical protein
MENKKHTKIKVKDSYGTTVIKKLNADATVEDMYEAFKDILLGLTYSDGSIDNYLNQNNE